ncbi:MAG: hypothetical protein ACTSRL_21365 [Candidatus Helarchaeota archaeon]
MSEEGDDNSPKIMHMTINLVTHAPESNEVDFTIILKDKSYLNLIEKVEPFIFNTEREIIVDIYEKVINGNESFGENGDFLVLAILKHCNNYKKLEIEGYDVKIKRDWRYISSIETYNSTLISAEKIVIGNNIVFFNYETITMRDQSIPQFPGGKYYLEIRIPEDTPEDEAERIGYDETEKFLDVLSLRYKAAFSIINFQLLRPREPIRRQLRLDGYELEQSELSAALLAEISDHIRRGMRWYRWALLARNEINRFLHFIVAFETLIEAGDPPRILHNVNEGEILRILRESSLLKDLEPDEREANLKRLAHYMKSAHKFPKREYYIKKCQEYGICLSSRLLRDLTDDRASIIHTGFIEGCIPDLQNKVKELRNIVETILEESYRKIGISIFE